MLKVCGTFARLYLRDGKRDYLQHIPLVMDYLNEAVIAAMPQQSPAFCNAASQLIDLLVEQKVRVQEKIREQVEVAEASSASSIAAQSAKKDK